MAAILFCAFYILLFSAVILRSKWFSAGGLRNMYFLAVFYLKLLFGLALIYIYTHIYTNRHTSDIFKYYDDAQLIFESLHTSVRDYVALLTGIGDTNEHCQAIYHSMNNWVNGYGTALYSNSHFIIRVNAFFLLFSREYYGVHIIFMCFISLVGLTYIYKAFIPSLQERSKMLFAAVFLFPSVILWSSGVLKEGFVWLGLGLSIYYFLRLVGISSQLPLASNQTGTKKPHKIFYILFLIAGLAVLYESKAYVLLCLFPCFVALFLIKKNAYCRAHPLLIYFFVLLLYMGSSFLPHILFNKLSPLKMIADKQTDFNLLCKGGIYFTNIKSPDEYAHISLGDTVNILPLNKEADSLLHKKGVEYLAGNPFWYNETKTKKYVPYMLRKGTHYERFKFHGKDTFHLIAIDSTAYSVCLYIESAKSSVYIEPVQPILSSVLQNIFAALKISVLMPYPWKVHSAMSAIYCAENMFVLLLIFLALFFSKRPFLHTDLILFCLLYCFMMLILIGLVTPILGGIERYKSVVMPFIFILLLLITQKPIAENK